MYVDLPTVLQKLELSVFELNKSHHPAFFLQKKSQVLGLKLNSIPSLFIIFYNDHVGSYFIIRLLEEVYVWVF